MAPSPTRHTPSPGSRPGSSLGGDAGAGGAFRPLPDYSKLNKERHVSDRADTFSTPSHLDTRSLESNVVANKRWKFGDSKEMSDICQDGMSKYLQRLSEQLTKSVRDEVQEAMNAVKDELVGNFSHSVERDASVNAIISSIHSGITQLQQEQLSLPVAIADALMPVREEIRNWEEASASGMKSFMERTEASVKEQVTSVLDEIGIVRQRQERAETAVLLQMREGRGAVLQIGETMQEGLKRSQGQMSEALPHIMRTSHDVAQMKADMSLNHSDEIMSFDGKLNNLGLMITQTLDLRTVYDLIGKAQKEATGEFCQILGEVGKIQQALNVDFAQVLDGIGEIKVRSRAGSVDDSHHVEVCDELAAKGGKGRRSLLAPALVREVFATTASPTHSPRRDLGDKGSDVEAEASMMPTDTMRRYKRLRHALVQTTHKHTSCIGVQTVQSGEPPVPKEKKMKKKKSVPQHKPKSTVIGGTMSQAKPPHVEPKRQVFADAEAMKQKVREALICPQYDVFNDYHTAGIAQKVAKSRQFDFLTLAVIFCNSLWIGVDTDYNDAAALYYADPLFQVVENLFCGYFTFELLVRFAAFRQKRWCVRDSWFIFDIVLVVMMVTETWIVTLVLYATGAGDNNDEGEGSLSANMFRAVRVVRLLRISRLARLARSIPELVIITKGLFAAARAVSIFFVMWLLIIYVFAIVFRQLTDSTSVGDLYFETVPAAMNTLLLDGVLPDSSNIVNGLADAHPLFWPIIMLFVLIASLTLMYMLIGVLVDVVCNVAATEKEGMCVSALASELREVMALLERDVTQPFGKEDFHTLLLEPEVVRIVQGVGVDVVVLIDMTDVVFDDGAGEDGPGTMTFEKFIDLILNMRGKNPATVQDLKQQQRFFKAMFSESITRMKTIFQDECTRLRAELIDLKSHVDQAHDHDGSSDESEPEHKVRLGDLEGASSGSPREHRDGPPVRFSIFNRNFSAGSDDDDDDAELT